MPPSGPLPGPLPTPAPAPAPGPVWQQHPLYTHRLDPLSPSSSPTPTHISPRALADSDGEDMNRRRHLYETAFDSRVPVPRDKRDEDVSNHAIMAVSPALSSQEHTRAECRRDVVASSDTLSTAASTALCGALSGMHLSSGSSRGSRGSADGSESPLRGYSPTPPGSAPASAPLPAKFHGAHGSRPRSMLAIRSAPHLHLTGTGGSSGKPQPQQQPVSAASRAVREIKGRPLPRPTSLFYEGDSSDQNASKDSSEDTLSRPRVKEIREFKGRPLSLSLAISAPAPTTTAAPRRPRPRFSSTESMATSMSSSGGSLESVRSTTSEGERSSSSDGRPGSSSLSSHSEDSTTRGPALHGSTGLAGLAGTARLYSHGHSHNSTKLHILSPISDKSSLEPCSETSDNNRNNNSERPSPSAEPGTGTGAATGAGAGAAAGTRGDLTPTGVTAGICTAGTGAPHAGTGSGGGSKAGTGTPSGTSGSGRRRPAYNTNLNISLALNRIGDSEVPGSDSGISVDGSGLQWSSGNKELEELPFDMPKLRRKKLQDPTAGSGSWGRGCGGAGGGAGGSAGAQGDPGDNEDLPFDMPKLRRKLRAAATTSESSSASQSLDHDIQNLPFDMPKLRRKLRGSSESSSTSQSDQPASVSTSASASASGSAGAVLRPSMCLNLTNGPSFGTDGFAGFGSSSASADPEGRAFGGGRGSAFAACHAGLGTNSAPSTRPRPGAGLSLSFGFNNMNAPSAHIDTSIPLERQGWYLGTITRVEAERLLRQAGEGSYLVRNSESTRQDFSLSLKSARGFMHMRIQKDDCSRFILGQFSRPFDSVPEMIRHFSVNRLPIRGAEHMCLLHPVIQPLL